MTLTGSRPVETSARKASGHWKGGLIMGKGHKPAIQITAGRKSRFVPMDLFESMEARAVRKTIEKRFKRLDPALRELITFDQGKENYGHKRLSENTAMAVYFCHPHSP